MVKCGNSYPQLVQIVREGRVLRKVVSGLPIFYLPRRDFIKETSFAQSVQGSINKDGGTLQDFEHAADGQLGYLWDPTESIDIDEDAKMLPSCNPMTSMGLGNGDMGIGDMGMGDIGLPSMGIASLGFGNPPLMGPSSMSMGNGGSSTPTSYAFASGCATPIGGGSGHLSGEGKRSCLDAYMTLASNLLWQ